MEFRMLGALEVRHEGREVPISGVKQRKALALLLWEAGRTVSIDRLIEALWDGEPPVTARRQVQNLVAALRRAMAAADPIERSGDGYRLRSEAVDWSRFRAEVAKAKTALAAGRWAEAHDLLRCALARWKGPALTGIDGERLSAVAQSMNDARLGACEDLFEVQLGLGLHREALLEIRTLASEHPQRQRLIGHLMLALYRSGDAAAALRTFADLAARLSEELGIEPDRGLRDLYVAILREDPGLDLEPTAAAPPGPAVPRVAAGTPPTPSDGLPEARIAERPSRTPIRLVALALVISLISLVVSRDGVPQTQLPDTVDRSVSAGVLGEPIWTYPAMGAESSVMMVDSGLLVLDGTELRLEDDGEVIWSIPVDAQRIPNVTVMGETILLATGYAGEQPGRMGTLTAVSMRSGERLWMTWNQWPVAMTEDTIITSGCAQSPNGAIGECALQSVHPHTAAQEWRVVLDDPSFPLKSETPFASPWGQPLVSDYLLVRSYPVTGTTSLDLLTAYDVDTGARLGEFDFHGVEDAHVNGEVVMLHEGSTFVADGRCEAHIAAYSVRSAEPLWERFIDTAAGSEGRCLPLPTLEGAQDLIPVTVGQSASLVWGLSGELQWTAPAPSSARLLIDDSFVTAEEHADRLTVWNSWSHEQRWTATGGELISAHGSTLWVVDRTMVGSDCGGVIGYDLDSGKYVCLPGSLEYLTGDVVVTVHNSTWQAWPADPWRD